MFFRHSIAYSTLVAIAMIVPAWGCSSEPPPTPPEIQEATGELKEPEIELGSDPQAGADSAEGPDAAEGGAESEAAGTPAGSETE